MPDILIGNIRGPQGETGPANTALASVYQFCTTDQGATIPNEGMWTSGVPQIEKGKYVWCRNIITWDSGPETILYSVGYVGNDGEFSGIELVNELGERVQALEDRTTPISKGGTESTTLEGAQAKLGITKLQEALAAVNDYTTGINLLPLTRNMEQGTKAVPFFSNFYFDGFNVVYPNQVEETIDEYGFTVHRFSRQGTNPDGTGGWTYWNYIPVIEIEPKKDYTLSFDLKIDAIATNGIFSLGFHDSSGTAIQGVNNNYSLTNANVHGIPKDHNQVELGKWYRVCIHFTSPADTKYFLGRCLQEGTSDFSCRKFKLEEGHINNPIWSQSPFDFANASKVASINDETTGINLLRGTRDFIQGTTPLVTGNKDRFTDGFYYNGGTVEKSTGDFSVYRNPTASFVGSLYPFENGVYTISAEIMFDEGFSSTSNNMAISLFRNQKGTSSINQSTNKGYNKAGLEQLLNTKFEFNQWYQISFSAEFSATDTNQYDYYITALCGCAYVRKVALYKGRINNPIWSQSPFDVASSYDVIEIIGNRSAIPEGDNINDYLTAGCYSCPTDASVSKISGLPSGLNVGFNLDVKYTLGVSNPSYISQVLTTRGDSTVYIRERANSTTWKPWRQTYANTTVRPYEGGGTNANSLEGAKQNLGITALEARIAALEAKLA